MSSARLKKVLVLSTGMFPDAATLEDALELAPNACPILRQDIKPQGMDDAAWDRLLGEILASKTIITL